MRGCVKLELGLIIRVGFLEELRHIHVMNFRLHSNGLDILAEIICGESRHLDDGGSPNLPYRRKIDIENFFSDLGLRVVHDPSRWPTARRSLADANNNEASIKKIVESLLLPANYAGLPDPTEAIDAIEPHIEAVGWSLIVSRTKVELRPQRPEGLSHLQDAIITASEGDSHRLIQDIKKARERATGDPSGAVTLACSLLETTCVFIINKHGGQLPKKLSVDPLFKEAVKTLGLSASSNTPKDLIRDDVYRIFSGLDSVVKGIGALRTHGGDAHGGNEQEKIDGRIARFAVDSSATIVIFLLETSMVRMKKL